MDGESAQVIGYATQVLCCYVALHHFGVSLKVKGV